MQSPGERKLWKEIDWSGNYKDKKTSMIPIHCMADYFETLYQPVDRDEVMGLNNLVTDMYIPITDDPITYLQVNAAVAKMKKGRYDFSLPVLKLLMPPLLIIFMNMLFYVMYPAKLSISLLNALPKKGDLPLMKNFRGNLTVTVVSSTLRQKNC